MHNHRGPPPQPPLPITFPTIARGPALIRQLLSSITPHLLLPPPGSSTTTIEQLAPEAHMSLVYCYYTPLDRVINRLAPVCP
jgi:hypothetical protein